MRKAFISYSHKDVKWAKWIQRKLETYTIPKEVGAELAGEGQAAYSQTWEGLPGQVRFSSRAKLG